MQRSNLYGLESLDSVRGQQLFVLVAESTSKCVYCHAVQRPSHV